MRLIDVSTPKFPNTFAKVDDEDYERLNAFNWCASEHGRMLYAARSVKSDSRWLKRKMHRDIMGNNAGFIVDHRDSDGLNNQRANLRWATRQTNQFNRKHVNQIIGRTSQYRGVSWDKKKRKWVAGIMLNRKRYVLGYHTSEVEAARAYDRAAHEKFGEFACPNF